MSKVPVPEFENAHHQPRKIDKRKRHRNGYNEDFQDRRHSRISFKRYLLELEEQLLDQEISESIKLHVNLLYAM